jgi:hypothetical protein
MSTTVPPSTKEAVVYVASVLARYGVDVSPETLRRGKLGHKDAVRFALTRMCHSYVICCFGQAVVTRLWSALVGLVTLGLLGLSNESEPDAEVIRKASGYALDPEGNITSGVWV